MVWEGEQKVMTRENLLALFEGTGDGVYVVDADLRIVFWNRAAEAMLGYAAEEAVGRYCYDVIAGGDYEGYSYCRDDCPVIDCASHREPVPSFDIYSHRKDGEGVWLNTSIISVAEPEGGRPLVVHLVRDVTPRRQAEVLAQRTLAAVSKYRPGSVESGEIQPYPPPAPRLTRREKEVLRSLAGGSSTEEIARTIGFSEAWVEKYMKGLFHKLGVRSRSEAVVYAAQHGLV